MIYRARGFYFLPTVVLELGAFGALSFRWLWWTTGFVWYRWANNPRSGRPYRRWVP